MDKLKLIKVLWNYMKIDDVPKKADCMIVLGTSRIDIVDYACSLYFKGFADKIIFSGGLRENYE